MTPHDAAGAILRDAAARVAGRDGLLIEAAAEGAEIVARRVPRVDTGALKQSVHAVGPRIVLDAPHAQVIELGARPHWAPLGPLLAWARRHGAENPWVLAKMVQAKIANEGQKPTYFVRDSLPLLKKALGRLLARGAKGAP